MDFRLFLATGTSPELLKTTFGPWDWTARPINCLVTFPFIEAWDKAQNELNIKWPVKSTILDSGAYSAWNSGKVIDFDKLCAEAGNGRWDEAVALDVIGDSDASLANARKMKERGLHVMPVFHFGESFSVLMDYKKEFKRIGLSCRFGEPVAKSMAWLDQCFARAYPAEFHSFGWVSEKALMRFPFTTADTASWHTGIRFGKGQAYPGLNLPRRTQVGPSAYDLRADVLHYLRLEERIISRWRTELQRFGELPQKPKPLQTSQPLEEELLVLSD
jgi:hypothetical protein